MALPLPPAVNADGVGHSGRSGPTCNMFVRLRTGEEIARRAENAASPETGPRSAGALPHPGHFPQRWNRRGEHVVGVEAVLERQEAGKVRSECRERTTVLVRTEEVRVAA